MINSCAKSRQTHSDYVHSVNYSVQVKVTDKSEKTWREDAIVLPSQLYKGLHGRVGEMSITNPLTNSSLKIKDIAQSTRIGKGSCKGSESEDFHPFCFLDKIAEQTGEYEIVVGEKILKELDFKEGSSVRLQNLLSPYDKVVDDSLQDKENPFGKSWVGHNYIAKGIFNGYQADVIPGRCGIFLGSMQISYLMLNKTLRPLCGETRYQAALSYNKDAIGVIQFFHEGKILEADVYPRIQCGKNYNLGSTVSVTESLYKQLELINRGDSLTLCSRFDVNSEQEVKEKTKGPILSLDPPYNAIRFIERSDDHLALLNVDGKDKETKSPIQRANSLLRDSLVDTKHATRTYDFIPQQKLAHFLESLSCQTAQLAARPELLARVFDFLDHLHNISDLEEMKEFEEFLDSIKAFQVIIEHFQNDYMDLVTNALKNNEEKDYNPLLLKALVAMGLNLKDRQALQAKVRL